MLMPRPSVTDLAGDDKTLLVVLNGPASVAQSGVGQIKAIVFKKKSNCARPPHPKGMGYASGRALRLVGFRNIRIFGFLDLLIRIIAYLHSVA
jgi:hypothetical protein